jgi:ATP-binding cassette subfamily B protein
VSAGAFFDALPRLGAAGSAADFAGFAFSLGFFALAGGLSGLARNYGGEFLARRVERDCRIEYYAALLKKDFLFHARRRREDLLPGTGADAWALGRMFSSGFVRGTEAVLGGAVFLYITAAIHPGLLFAPVVFMVLTLPALGAYNRRLSGNLADAEEKKNRLLADAEEILSGLKAARPYAADEVNRFNNDALFARDSFVRREINRARYWPGPAFCLCLGAAAFQVFFLLRRGGISPGEAAAFLCLFHFFLFAAKKCAPASAAIRRGMEAAARMFAVTRAESGGPAERKEASPAILPGRSSGRKTFAGPGVLGRVDFDNVFFSYDSTIALRRINFSVLPETFVVITGRSGSGKTTLAMMLGCLLDPVVGTVSIDGIDIRDWDRQALASRIAVIEQEPFLLPLSIRDNIALGNSSATAEDIRAAAEKAEAHGFISRLEGGYDTPAEDAALSPDQKLRIALARALLADPRILVVDDAAGPADSETEDEIRKALQTAARGRTVFVVSHRLGEIRWADHILFMKDGEIARQGNHEHLVIGSADYRRIFSGI